MLALYRSGRQAEALRAYREAAATSQRKDLGIEAEPAAATPHHQILGGHADLAAPTGTPPVIPQELPRDIASFTGRTAEIAFLDGIATARDGYRMVGAGEPGPGRPHPATVRASPGRSADRRHVEQDGEVQPERRLAGDYACSARLRRPLPDGQLLILNLLQLHRERCRKISASCSRPGRR